MMELVNTSSIMASHENDVVTLQSIHQAAERVKLCVHETPILTSSSLNEIAGRQLYFKCENFQKTGSFKIRGAMNTVLRLKEEANGKDIVALTHSSGNFAQALAFASTNQGIKNRIVMPSNAPQVKKNATKGYGGNITYSESSERGRVQTANEILKELSETGEYISSADHPFLIDGQGTLGLEIMKQVPEVDTVIACCSAGGLLSGISVACTHSNKNVKVFGAEPKAADDTARSMKANKRIVLTEPPNTIADGLRMSVGKNTWPVIRDNVTDIITVTEDEIVRAMFLLWERLKVIVEPSGAVPFAAALTEQFKVLSPDAKHVVVLISGGNTDLLKVPWLHDPEKYDLTNITPE